MIILLSHPIHNISRLQQSTIQDLFNVDTSENDATRRMADVLQKEGEQKLGDEPVVSAEGIIVEKTIY